MKIDHGLGAIGLVGLAIALTGLVFGGVFFAPLTAAMVKADNVSDWLGFAGSVIGGVITLIAAILAWIGISRQIRISVAAREEDRQDQIIPSLRAAEDKIEWFMEEIRAADGSIQPSRIYQALNDYGITEDFGQMLLRLEGDLPATDDSIRRTLAHHFAHVRSAFIRCHDVDQAPAPSGQEWETFLEALARLDDTRADLLARRTVSEHRRLRLRAELEQYFDR